MRDKVPRTETVVGAVVLLLLAGIATAFVVTTITNKDYLFTIDPAHQAGEEPREIRVARTMMPPLGTAGWLPAKVEACKPDQIPPDLPDFAEALADYDVQLVYSGRYENGADPSEFVSVYIFDVGQPERAMGLYQGLMPSKAKPLAAGRHGWQLDGQGSFWSGRYCTMFDTSRVAADHPSVMTVASVLSGAQLLYGGPFWAEAILPKDNQIPGSLTFVAKDALSLEALSNTFTVDYADGAACFALDAGSIDRALGVLASIETLMVEHGRVDAKPNPPDTYFLAGGIDDRELACFSAGDFVYGAASSEMGRSVELAKQMLDATGVALRASNGSTQSASHLSPTAEKRLPMLDVSGWSGPANYRVFTPATLYEKIDGRAGLFLQFHAAELAFGSYRDAAGQVIDVYRYDMGEAANAFGIFRAEFGGHVEPIDIGRDAYASGPSVFFWKGRCYVSLIADGEQDDLTDVVRTLAKTIAEAISDEGQPLWAERMLPEENRVPGSFDYLATSAFSLDFLNDVFKADYRIGDETLTLFIHRADDEDAAREVIEKYVAFFKSYGKVLANDEYDTGRWAVGDTDDIYDAVFNVGKYVGGVSGADNPEKASDLANTFRESLIDESEDP